MLVALAALVSAGVALAAPSDLDTSFNGSGKLQIDFGGFDRATHVALAPDGKIIAVGTTASAAGNTPGEYAITRVNPDGTPDSSFGGGTVALASPTNAIGGGVVVLANNQIVVTGQGNTTADFVTKRLNANGSVDASFGTGGTSTVDFGGTDQANAMALQPDGKLVLVGTTSTGGGDFAIARLNANGTPDTSFGTGGKRTINFGGSPDVAFAVAIQPDGKIVVAGMAGGVGDMVVTRLNPNGSNDTSFAPPGDQASIGFGGSNDAANAMALQPDGKILLAGSTDAAGSAGSAIARLNANGTLDTSFGTGGKLTPNFGGSGEAAVGVVVQQNGKIAVLSNADANHDFVVARYNPNGGIDAGFGTSGHVAVDFGGDEFDGDLALQPDGKLVLAGSTDVGTNYDMAIARLNGDPIGTTTTTAPTTTPPPPPTPGPVASFQPIRSSAFKGGTAFTAVGSKPSPGAKLIKFQWDIRTFLHNVAVVDTDCGPQPVVGTPYKATKFKVSLTVSDTAGRSSRTTQYIDVAQLGVKPGSVHENGVFDCENPSSGSQASTPGCAKSFGWGFLDVNSRGAADDCFQITGNGNGFYTGKVKGPVAVNGLYVPIPKGITTDYDSNGNISADGLSQIPIRIGPFLTENVPLVYKVTPNKQGVYHLVNVDEAVNAPKILGSLPLRGAFSVDLIRHASQVTVGVGLPSPLSFGGKRAAQADAHLYLDNTDGLQFDGLKLTVPDVWLGPIYVKDLSFDYTKSSDTWGGGASVTLPGSSITLSGSPTVSPDFGFGLKNGKFDHAGFGVSFNPPAQPDLFPPFHTVLLSYIGASVGLNPLRITGRIGITAANIVDETGELFAVFADAQNQYTLPENPGSELAPLANRTFDRFALAIAGTAAVKVPIFGGQIPLLNAYGLYEYPDYFEFGGGFSYKVSLLKLDGNVSGFVYPSSGKFNAQGGVSACLDGVKIGFKFVSVTIHPCLQIGAVISSRGVGFCGTIGVPFPIFGTIPVVVGAGYHWGDSFPKLMIFSCDYKPYAEASPLAHTSAVSGYGVNLPPKLPSAMFRVHGQGGAPDVTVTDPHGNPITGSANAITLQGSEPDTTLVALRHPSAGPWRITPAAGSVPLAGVETADGIPAVALKSSVRARGNRRVLHYHFNAAKGRTVTFVEQGPDTSRVLGKAHGSTGTITFTPGSGRGGRRSIIAQVEQDGAPAENVKVASYSAPRPGAPGRPGGVRARRRHGQIAVSWRRVRGARRYEMLVKLADGSEVFRVVRNTHVTVADPIAGRRGTVSVDAVSMDGTRGKAVSVRIAKVVVHHMKPKKRKKHHR